MTDNTKLITRALVVAASQIGVTEEPPGSNRGPEVDQYLKSVGLGPGYPWCAAFVYWCFLQAAKELVLNTPLVKTAGVLDHWNRCQAKGAKRYTASQIAKNPALLKPGMIFIIDFGKGAGHEGLIEAVQGNYILTLEGNTNNDGSRNGEKVLRRKRTIASINLGFIDYTTV